MRLFKKFLPIFISLLLSCVAGCSKVQDKPENHVSQIRTDVFLGEQDDVCVFIYAEQREFPFLNDKFAGERKNCLVIKIPGFDDENASCQISYGNQSITAKLSYDVVTASLGATVQVKSLPTSVISVNFKDKTVNLTSQLKADSITPKQALKCVEKSEKDFISSLYSDGVFDAEIYLRLLTEGEFNYYYVGFARGEGKITAFLLDAKTGEIIAGKTL